MNRRVLFLHMLCTFLTLAAISCPAQQQLVHTSVKENISCNYDCTVLDIPELNKNPSAILFVTPVTDKGVVLNPHPIGAYYFKEKWHIFNLDSRPIAAGAKFTVSYYRNPDASHFQYSFTRTDIQTDGSALIDHPALNNNPAAKFTSFLSWDPNSQGGTTNREVIKAGYNVAAGKWSISNKNQKPLFARVTYNILIEDAGKAAVLPAIDTSRISQPMGGATVKTTGNAVFANISFMYMSAWADGIILPGDNLRKDHLEKTEVLDFEMEATSIARKNNYQAITIRIASGYPAEVPLLQAFMKKQSMSFTLEGLGTSQVSGKEELILTIKLIGAYISGYKQKFFDPEAAAGAGVRAATKKSYDEIKIMFTRIEYINSAGVTAVDNP